MATIVEKNTRRYRVQFTMSRPLHQSYEGALERARKLGLVIDFSRDFEKWFANQLEQVSRELQQLEDESQREQHQFAAQERHATADFTPQVATDHEEGGAGYGDDREY